MRVMITASMLYSFTTCPHRVYLDLHGDPAWRDETSAFVELLWERGHAFEEETVAALRVPFENLRQVPREAREESTRQAMERGAQLIYGGRISHARLLGEPDLLRREGSGYVPGDIKSGVGVEGACDASDGKPKRHYAVQLALYSDILRHKGVAASTEAFVWDIHGEEIRYNLASPRGPRVSASMWDEYRMALAAVQDIASGRVQTRPALIGECALCPWRSYCRRQIVRDDDLTLVPELGRAARAKFPAEISTVADLARRKLSDLVAGDRSAIPGIGCTTLRRYHARAVLQKTPAATPYFTAKVLLPKSDVELFFDVETDPFRSLCYLHGFVERVGKITSGERYVSFFAEEAVEAAERDAFARAWAYVRGHRDAVVYFYSHYERTIWRQLARRFPEVTTEREVEALFDESRFLDLYSDIVKSRMIWPTPSLSLKTLARFLGFAWRDTDPSGAGSIQWFHQWVETGDATVRQRILAYNEDDCRALRVLVDAIGGLPGSA